MQFTNRSVYYDIYVLYAVYYIVNYLLNAFVLCPGVVAVLLSNVLVLFVFRCFCVC